jgi:hypothetical protein
MPRTTKSQPRARIGITEVSNDAVRATIRLQHVGQYRATAETSYDDSACAAHSYGEIREFFTTHRCSSLYRGLVESPDKDYVILISIATVDMGTHENATGLHSLLFDPDNGGIITLSQERGRYRRVSFAHAPTW